MSNTDRIEQVLREQFQVSAQAEWLGTPPVLVNIGGLAYLIDAELHPVIETVEQLDALPPGSVVLEAMGRYGDFLGITTIPGVFHKFPAPVEGWYVVAGHGARESTSIELPARVLYTPEADR